MISEGILTVSLAERLHRCLTPRLKAPAAAARTSRTDDLFIAILERVARQNGLGAGAPAKGKLYASNRIAA